MKKLQKRFSKRNNTVAKYNNTCSCYCNAPYCSGLWKDQNDADSKRNFSSNYERDVYS